MVLIFDVEIDCIYINSYLRTCRLEGAAICPTFAAFGVFGVFGIYMELISPTILLLKFSSGQSYLKKEHAENSPVKFLSMLYWYIYGGFSCLLGLALGTPTFRKS
jgi:hypothetical protein